MTDIPDPIRCAKCCSHDVAVTSTSHYDSGDALVIRCDACGAVTARWQPRADVTP